MVDIIAHLHTKWKPFSIFLPSIRFNNPIYCIVFYKLYIKCGLTALNICLNVGTYVVFASSPLSFHAAEASSSSSSYVREVFKIIFLSRFQ